MYSDGSAAQNIMPVAKIKNGPPLLSLRENNNTVLVMPYEIQRKVKIKAGSHMQVHVVSGGVN